MPHPGAAARVLTPARLYSQLQAAYDHHKDLDGPAFLYVKFTFVLKLGCLRGQAFNAVDPLFLV